MKILVTPTSLCRDRDVPTLDPLRAFADELVFNETGRPMTEQELIDALPGVDAVVAGLDEYTGDVLRSTETLRVISRYGVGVNNVDLTVAAERGVVVTRTPGMATFAAFVTGLLTAAISPIGPLALVPLLCAAVTLDLVLPLRRGVRAGAPRILIAGAAAGVVLFAVALPVFSPEHLVAPVLIATLAARIAGELAVAAGVVGIRRLLVRAGAVR